MSQLIHLLRWEEQVFRKNISIKGVNENKKPKWLTRFKILYAKMPIRLHIFFLCNRFTNALSQMMKHKKISYQLKGLYNELNIEIPF
jgi:hypothetical protein